MHFSGIFNMGWEKCGFMSKKYYKKRNILVLNKIFRKICDFSHPMLVFYAFIAKNAVFCSYYISLNTA